VRAAAGEWGAVGTAAEGRGSAGDAGEAIGRVDGAGSTEEDGLEFGEGRFFTVHG